MHQVYDAVHELRLTAELEGGGGGGGGQCIGNMSRETRSCHITIDLEEGSCHKMIT